MRLIEATELWIGPQAYKLRRNKGKKLRTKQKKKKKNNKKEQPNTKCVVTSDATMEGK